MGLPALPRPAQRATAAWLGDPGRAHPPGARGAAVCRYDTAALKVLDVFSVHGFPVHRVQCEAALIGIPRVGSGGYRHFLAKYAAAKRYCNAPFETMRVDGRKRRVPVPSERIASNL